MGCEGASVGLLPRHFGRCGAPARPREAGGRPVPGMCGRDLEGKGRQTTRRQSRGRRVVAGALPPGPRGRVDRRGDLHSLTLPFSGRRETPGRARRRGRDRAIRPGTPFPSRSSLAPDRGREDRYSSVPTSSRAAGSCPRVPVSSLRVSGGDVRPLASRAVVHYQARPVARRRRRSGPGRRARSRAPRAVPESGRGAAGVGRRDEAARDLSTYLELCPDAEDRDAVQESLSTLAGVR
jgi:hypothetical protein